MRFLAQNMPKMRLRPGLRPGACWGAYSAPPDPLAGFGGRFAAGRGEERIGGEGPLKLRITVAFLTPVRPW